MKELDDLKRYGQKTNEMIKVSLEGDCPQIFKLILLRDMVNFTINEIRKTGSEKSYEEIEEFIQEFLGDIQIEVNQMEVKKMKEKEIKEVICEIYESIKTGSNTPRFVEIIEEYRNWLETADDMKREASN